MSLLKRNFKVKVKDDLLILNGEEFERFSKLILELILNEKIVHKGHNLYAKPVGYTADFADGEYEIIGQAGTDQDYFDDFEKPIKDIKSAIKNHESAKKIYLFSNRYAGTSRLGDLKVKTNVEFSDRKVIPYDCERIADEILEKIIASHIIDDIFYFLPSAYELYRMLPGTNSVPAHKDQYYTRNDEIKIIKQLAAKSVVQIYGLSGIGKSEITIEIARRIAKNFETVIWVDGDAIQNMQIDFNAIKISKFDKLFNLAATLESYKVLVVFDNINYNINDLVSRFELHNKNESQCLISSLSKMVDSEMAYPLLEISSSIAGKIISGEDPSIDRESTTDILKYTGKHPLILKIIRVAIKNKMLSWTELIEELKDLNLAYDNERNQTIAGRILGRIKHTIERELAALKYINNRLVSKSLLDKVIGKFGVDKLKNNTIIASDDAKYYNVHQIILDSIKTEITNAQWEHDFEYRIKTYLMLHNETKDISFYNVVFNHDNLISRILSETNDTDLKRIIVYSMIQSIDIKNPKKTEELVKLAIQLINNGNTYYETLLSIELGEIKLWGINKKVEKDRYLLEANQEITTLSSKLNDSLDSNYRATILHHIGKLQLKLGNRDEAMKMFEEVLVLKPKDPFALLQVARIVDKDEEKLTEIVEYVFSLKDCPLSILLSFYELIVYNNQNLRKKYIDDDISVFTSKIIEAVDSSYDQPYSIIAKLSRDLSYNQPEYFAAIIDSLPTPSNLDYNEELRFNYGLILSSYYKYGDLDAEPDKMKKALLLAKSIFSNTPLEGDYKKGVYVDVLIADRAFDLAFEQLEKFKDRNEFYFQKLSKTYRGMGLYPDAVSTAQMAIDYHKNKNQINYGYFSAFFNDKAEAEHAENGRNGLTTLKEAIQLQPNNKTKKEWAQKLIEWES